MGRAPHTGRPKGPADRVPRGGVCSQGGRLFSRVYAGDVAEAVLAALVRRQGVGECFNVVESQTAPIRLFYQRLITAAGASLELIRVPDEALPPDFSCICFLGHKSCCDRLRPMTAAMRTSLVRTR